MQVNQLNKINLQSYKAKADILKAIAHPTRLWIVEQLYSGERCVCELVEGVDADFSTVSKHISVLKNAGLVTDDKRGKKVFYSLNTPCVLDFMSCIENIIKAM